MPDKVDKTSGMKITETVHASLVTKRSTIHVV